MITENFIPLHISSLPLATYLHCIFSNQSALGLFPEALICRKSVIHLSFQHFVRIKIVLEDCDF